MLDWRLSLHFRSHVLHSNAFARASFISMRSMYVRTWCKIRPPRYCKLVFVFSHGRIDRRHVWRKKKLTANPCTRISHSLLEAGDQKPHRTRRGRYALRSKSHDLSCSPAPNFRLRSLGRPPLVPSLPRFLWYPRYITPWVQHSQHYLNRASNGAYSTHT